MTWLSKHRESERLASEAEFAKHRGAATEARSLYKTAAQAEAEALKLVLSDKPKTLGVTAVSAVALNFKAHEFDLAEELALSCLVNPQMPAFAKEELRAVAQTIWNERLFKSSGVEFVGGELLVSVAGGLIAVGAAPLELVHRKVDEVKNLFFRAIEMLMEKPLRRHGSPSQELREQFRPWMVQAPAGSYQFALRVEKPRQMEIFPNATPAVENATHTLLKIVEAASTGSIDQFSSVIPREDYRECFIKQTRNLAPTGKTFDRLTIRSTSQEDVSPIVLSPRSRKALAETLRATASITPGEDELRQEQIVGVLRAVHLDKDWLEVADEKTGEHITVYQTGNVIDDLVGPMVNHKVVVEVRVHPDGKRVFKDIQSEE